MKILVVYDSEFGNTGIIAQAVAEGLRGEVRIVPVHDYEASLIDGLNCLVVGSPTQGGRPTRSMNEWLGKMPERSLHGIAAAAFDTRIDASASFVGLRILMKMIGFAAPRLAATLQRKGGRLVAPAEGFVVEGKEGPLRDGETARARAWAQQITWQ